jgi:RNA 3'-terminal phosphate cyclase-like protein
LHIVQNHFRSPGFGVLLIAESSKGDRLMAEAYARVGEKESPEDVGQRAVRRLLSEIEGDGVVDRPSSWIVLLWMALTPEDISRIRFSKDLSPYAIQIMRNIKKFFGIRFDIVDDREKPSTCIISCRGTGYHNISKKVI